MHPKGSKQPNRVHSHAQTVVSNLVSNPNRLRSQTEYMDLGTGFVVPMSSGSGEPSVYTRSRALGDCSFFEHVAADIGAAPRSRGFCSGATAAPERIT